MQPYACRQFLGVTNYSYAHYFLLVILPICNTFVTYVVFILATLCIHKDICYQFFRQ